MLVTSQATVWWATRFHVSDQHSKALTNTNNPETLTRAPKTVQNINSTKHNQVLCSLFTPDFNTVSHWTDRIICSPFIEPFIEQKHTHLAIRGSSRTINSYPDHQLKPIPHPSTGPKLSPPASLTPRSDIAIFTITKLVNFDHADGFRVFGYLIAGLVVGIILGLIVRAVFKPIVLGDSYESSYGEWRRWFRGDGGEALFQG